MVICTLRQHDDFVSGVLTLANTGGMQGAACTVYGQVAGAFYRSIPIHWRQKIVQSRNSVVR
jgi:ADP-ribosylglycohydrolase